MAVPPREQPLVADGEGPRTPRHRGVLASHPHADASMGAILARSYARYRRRPAIVEESRTLTFAELEGLVHRTANALLQLGLKKGDRVALWVDNGPEFLSTEHAVFRCGFVRTALSPRLHVDEVVGVLNDCRPAVVLTDSSRAGQLATRRGDLVVPPAIIAVADPDADGVLCLSDLLAGASSDAPGVPLPEATDLAALLYTSGTTGRPKAAMLTNRSWVAMVAGLMAELPLIDETDVVLHSAPMSHLSGSIGGAYCARGAATMMLTRFDARRVLDTVERHRVTALPMVPTMLASLTAVAETGSYDLSCLRAIPYGGSAISAQLLHRASSAFGNVLVQLYGLSEALVPLAVLSPSGHRVGADGSAPAHLSSAGRPTPFVDLRVVSEEGREVDARERGEIHVRGATVMSGYWCRPEATADVIGPDGWVRTGDIGYRDDDGYVYIVDRKSDVIVSGGFNVYPAEVERVVQSLPQVHEVVVVGAPHPRWGEGVTAVITLKPGERLTAEQVIAVCREHLADYKKPVTVAFVDELPKNTSGKLLRRAVRDAYWHGLERRIGE